jgi:hypothetical protein
MGDGPNHPDILELRSRIHAIERDVDAGGYRPGPWDAFIRAVMSQSDGTRAALADDISRVSRKLHLRSGRRTMPLAAAIAIELAATVLGAILLAIALKENSNIAAIVAMIIWVTTFQPLVKVAAGTMLGVGYEYGYLYGTEPRFKMKFGRYVAAPRWKRMALHACGMAGSPLGAIVAAWIAADALPLAHAVCLAAFWLLLALNLILMTLALLGVRRLGGLRMADGSGGALALELLQVRRAARGAGHARRT